jgi:4-hydroxybenzoyl-CoA thioesterase
VPTLTPRPVPEGEGASGEYLAVRVQVAWGDCDPAGIVFYPRFYAWMDSVSHVLAREMGIAREAMLPPRADLVGFPIVRAEAQFLAPARLDDTLEVRARVARIGRTSLGLRHEIVRIEADGSSTAVAYGQEERVFVGNTDQGLQPRELSPAMRTVLARFSAGAADGLQRS